MKYLEANGLSIILPLVSPAPLRYVKEGEITNSRSVQIMERTRRCRLYYFFVAALSSKPANISHSTLFCVQGRVKPSHLVNEYRAIHIRRTYLMEESLLLNCVVSHFSATVENSASVVYVVDALRHHHNTLTMRLSRVQYF